MARSGVTWTKIDPRKIDRRPPNPRPFHPHQPTQAATAAQATCLRRWLGSAAAPHAEAPSCRMLSARPLICTWQRVCGAMRACVCVCARSREFVCVCVTPLRTKAAAPAAQSMRGVGLLGTRFRHQPPIQLAQNEAAIVWWIKQSGLDASCTLTRLELPLTSGSRAVTNCPTSIARGASAILVILGRASQL